MRLPIFDQIKTLYNRYLRAFGDDREKARNAMLKITQKPLSKDWTVEDIRNLKADAAQLETRIAEESSLPFENQTVDAEFVEQAPPQTHVPTQAELRNKIRLRYAGFFNGSADAAKNAIYLVTEGRTGKDWTEDDILHLNADLAQRIKQREVQAAEG